MDASDALQLAMLGGVLGAVGQIMRVVIGMAKHSGERRRPDDRGRSPAPAADASAPSSDGDAGLSGRREGEGRPGATGGAQPEDGWFQWWRFTYSVMIGAAAGVMFVLTSYYGQSTLEQRDLLTVVAAGYVGADFLEGMIQAIARRPGGVS